MLSEDYDMGEEEDPISDTQDIVFSEKRSALNMDFIIESSQWQDFVPQHKALIADIISFCFQKASISLSGDAHNNISLTFLDDDKIKEINNEWRGKDKATNVLSFPTFDEEELQNKDYVNAPVNEFGDIIIAWSYCKAEAENVNIPFSEHIFHMVIHGILHILGYDHIEIEDAEKMEALEIEILKKFGYENPYTALQE